MRKLINRLICLCRGHKWMHIGNPIESRFFECSRCKLLKEDDYTPTIKEELEWFYVYMESPEKFFKNTLYD